MSKVFGLVGADVNESFSPLLHSFFSEDKYHLYSLSKEALEIFLNGRSYDGLNITIPYKQTVLPYLQELGPQAKRIGSVNTIVRREDGSLYGENTDYNGMAYCLQRLSVSLNNQTVLILGSGGTSRTACALVEDLGGFPVIISRHGENHYGNLERFQNAFGIINTTPVGMSFAPDFSPVDLRLFDRLSFVLDVIYHPLRTKLLQQAEKLHIPCIGGLPMLVCQAAYSRKLFDGELPSLQAIQNAEFELRKRNAHLVLICDRFIDLELLQEKLSQRLRLPVQKISMEGNGMSNPALKAAFQGKASMFLFDAASLSEEDGFHLKMNGLTIRLTAEPSFRSSNVWDRTITLTKDTDDCCYIIEEAYYAFLHFERS